MNYNSNKVKMKIIEYFKNKISQDEGTLERALSSIGIANDSLLLSEEQERLDSLIEEFDINESTDIEQVFEILKAFGLAINADSDEAFIDKIEGIKKAMQCFGYENIQEVTKEELEKIKVLLEACELKLDKVTEYESSKIKKTSDIGGLSTLKELSLEEVGELSEFIKAIGIKFTQSKKELENIKHVGAFLQSQGVSGKDLLSNGSIKKLNILFKELKVNSIDKWKSVTSDSIDYILKEFGLELRETSPLKLKIKLKKLEPLNLANNLDKALSRIKVMKEFVGDLSEIGDEEIKELISKKDIIELGLKEEHRELVVNFGIDVAREQAKYRELESFLSEFGISIEDLSNYEAEEINKVLERVGAINHGTIDVNKKELLKIIIKEFSYENFTNLKSEDIERLKIIGARIELEENQIFSKEGISRIKLIVTSLGIDFKELRDREAESIGDVLKKYGITEAVKSQGYVSWLVSGAESIIKSKTEEFAAKIKLLGYEITNFDLEDYSKIELAVKEVGSLNKISYENLKLLKDNYKKLGVELVDISTRRIEELKDVLSKLNLSIAIDQDVANLEALGKAFEIDIEDLSKVSQKLLDEYGVDLKGSSVSKINELAGAIKDLGYRLYRLHEEDISCISQVTGLKPDGSTLEKLKYASLYIAKFKEDYSNFNQEECDNFINNIKLLKLEKGGEDYKIDLYKKIEDKCEIDYRDELNKEAKEAIIKAVEEYDGFEACKLSDTDECKALVLSGIEPVAEITSEICNQVKEEL